ncbi:hypothetical protein [Halospeciosus flavus]|uniref:hypothetical protein n=1 Tax=Halospeciosus flavus TaxID=3032283 RepID=UPI003616A092
MPGDPSLPDLETTVQALESRESDGRIVGGLEAVFNINDSNSDPEPIVEYVRTVQSLPDPYRRLVEGLYVDTLDRDWRTLLQRFERDRVGRVIEWWVTNERFLPADLTADIDRTKARRLVEVSKVNNALSIASADPIDWKTEVDSVTANVQWQDVVPAELQIDSSTDTRWQSSVRRVSRIDYRYGWIESRMKPVMMTSLRFWRSTSERGHFKQKPIVSSEQIR